MMGFVCLTVVACDRPAGPAWVIDIAMTDCAKRAFPGSDGARFYDGRPWTATQDGGKWFASMTTPGSKGGVRAVIDGKTRHVLECLSWSGVF